MTYGAPRNRVKETTTTTGTGTVSLAGASTGFQSFVTAGLDGLEVIYCVDDNVGNWEVGRGTIADGSPDTMTRVEVLDGSAGAGVLVAFAVGIKDVFMTLSPDRAMFSSLMIGGAVAADAGKAPVVVSTGFLALAGPDGQFNSVLNPDCAVDQINNGTAVAIVNGDDDKLCGPDGWKAQFVGAGAASLSRVVADIPSSVYPGVVPAYALKVDVTTADTSLAAGDRHTIRIALEGYDTAWMRFGGAQAQVITVSMFVKSPKTGLHTVGLLNSARTRSYPGQITVVSANTWERRSFTLTADATGSWLTDTGTGLLLAVNLGSGSTYQSAASAWAAGAFWSVSGDANIMDSTANDFFITGIQIDPGSVVLPYRGVPLATNLNRCRRYIAFLSYDTAGGEDICNGYAIGTTAARCTLTVPAMRIAPAVTLTAAATFALNSSTGGGVASGVTAAIIGRNAILFSVTVAAGLTDREGLRMTRDGTDTTNILLNAASV